MAIFLYFGRIALVLVTSSRYAARPLVFMGLYGDYRAHASECVCVWTREEGGS